MIKSDVMKFMNSNTFCPVSDKRINEQVARLNAGFTFGLILAFLFTQNILPLLFLTVDFLLRTSGQERFSVVAMASSGIARYLALQKIIINAGPKIFAARIGFILTALVVILWLLEWKIASLVFIALLGIFSFLEAATGICVACAIYPILYKILHK